jgi:diguanylate cyclase (GGDEF)-like protein
MQTSVEQQQRTILVVDDDPATARVVRKWYDNQPFEILDAPEGKSGLETAAEIRPDLILLDLRMPGVDGIEVARKIRSDPRTRAIPVLLLSACKDVGSKLEAFSAGADDYVTKPFEFQELDARIQVLLSRREMLAGLESRIRDLNHHNEELEQLLVVDERTGLYNLRYFQQKLREEWSRADRYGGPLSLILFDLDDFSRINERYTHLGGNAALEQFATLLRGGARATDVAARYGGEEFAVILPHTDGPMAARVAERVREAVEGFGFTYDRQRLRFTVSGGIATFPSTAGVDSTDSLIHAADTALFEAKRAGKNRIVTAAADSSSS